MTFDEAREAAVLVRAINKEISLGDLVDVDFSAPGASSGENYLRVPRGLAQRTLQFLQLAVLDRLRELGVNPP